MRRKGRGTLNRTTGKRIYTNVHENLIPILIPLIPYVNQGESTTYKFTNIRPGAYQFINNLESQTFTEDS